MEVSRVEGKLIFQQKSTHTRLLALKQALYFLSKFNWQIVYLKSAESLFIIFRCEDHRCMDPGQCCDPTIDPSCTILRDCCRTLIESGRQFYKLGVERRNKEDLKFLHSTIYTVIGQFLGHYMKTRIKI